MALFNKEKKEDKKKKAVIDSGSSTKISINRDLHPGQIIVSPRITEKAAIATEKGVYTFEVARNANKIQIANAIKALYKVTPIKIRLAKIAEKTVTLKHKRGTGSKGGGKKAMVYLKKGDTITVM